MVSVIQFEASLTSLEFRGASPVHIGGASQTKVTLPNGLTMNFSGFHYFKELEGFEENAKRFAQRSYDGPVRFKITIEEIA